MRRYIEEEKAEIFKGVESFGKVSLVAKKHGRTFNTIQNWIRKGINNSNPSRVRELKKTISKQKLQISILKGFLKNSPELLKRKAIVLPCFSLYCKRAFYKSGFF